jgi:glutathione S-transferase
MTTNHLKLYHSFSSPNSRRVRMFLAEKGLTVPLAPVDLAKGEQHSDAYRAINPRRVVPTLVLEDRTAIGEVLAIWRYFEEVYPTPPLLGSTPKDKALVTMWERRTELEGFAAVMEGVRNAAERLKGRAIAGPHDYDQIPALVALRSGSVQLVPREEVVRQLGDGRQPGRTVPNDRLAGRSLREHEGRPGLEHAPSPARP